MLIFVPDAQIHVLAAHEGTGKFHRTVMCLSAWVVHIILSETASVMQILLLLMPLLEFGLDHALGVRIGLSLQIRQDELLLLAASIHR